MIKKRILNDQRIRRIDGGFAFIPHRFLTDGYLSALNPSQQQLYFFLVLAADRHGLSFYSYDAICSLLQMSLDQYIEARNDLIEKDVSFRQACMTRIKKDVTIGYPTIGKEDNRCPRKASQYQARV